MTELAEAIAIGLLEEEMEAKCPFKDPADGVASKEDENIASDDSDGAKYQQSNNGGVLGDNLAKGSPGKAGTVGGPCAPPKAKEVPRNDTRRTGVRVRVPATSKINEATYGFTVAAHHLIPGEAALEPSDLKPFMTQGESVEVTTDHGDKTKEITKHIGYNVNGAHNGVWLPGNYYIRTHSSPIKGASWSALGDDPWCLNYVAAVSMAANGQIHDAHTKYSDAVKELLNAIALKLSRHECDDCKSDKINPPFRMKIRLYNLSSYFRIQVTALPEAWKRPWFTSDRWREDAFSGGKPSKAFGDAYRSARVVKPGEQ